MCKELGLVSKQAVSDHSPAEKSGPSYEMDDTLSEAFLEYFFGDFRNIVMIF